MTKFRQSGDVHTLARAKAAAASDARMGGGELPVVINSGSGNQGITVCVPVVEYALELGSSRESLYRALAMEMYDAGQQFYGGDGIVLKGVENTIRNVGVLGRHGMKETDKTIIELMTK